MVVKCELYVMGDRTDARSSINAIEIILCEACMTILNSGGGRWPNQVGLIGWQENISMVKIKILWSTHKIRWGCSPTLPAAYDLELRLLVLLVECCSEELKP